MESVCAVELLGEMHPEIVIKVGVAARERREADLPPVRGNAEVTKNLLP